MPFAQKSTVTEQPSQRGFSASGMSTCGRLRLFAIKGVEVPVFASKQPFTKCNFQHCEGLKTATYIGPSWVGGLHSCHSLLLG